MAFLPCLSQCSFWFLVRLLPFFCDRHWKFNLHPAENLSRFSSALDREVSILFSAGACLRAISILGSRYHLYTGSHFADTLSRRLVAVLRVTKLKESVDRLEGSKNPRQDRQIAETLTTVTRQTKRQCTTWKHGGKPCVLLTRVNELWRGCCSNRSLSIYKHSKSLHSPKDLDLSRCLPNAPFKKLKLYWQVHI